MRNLERSIVAIAFLLAGNAWAEESIPQPVEEKKAEETPAPAPAASEEETKKAEAPAAEAPAAEEIRAVEVVAEESKAKVEDLKGFQQVQGSEPAVGTTVAASETASDGKPFTARVVTGLSVGTGGFIKNDALRKTSNYISQDWDLRPGYQFELMGHKLKVAARFVFGTELTTPNNGNARRVNSLDTGLSLSDGEIYKEPITDIKLSGSVGWLFPTSYESLKVKNQWGAASTNLTLDRSIGPVDLSWGVTLRKFFNSEPVAGRIADASTASSKTGSQSNKDEGQRETAEGAPNTSFDVRNIIGATYNVTEQLSVSYELLIWNSWNYSLDQTEERDAHTAPAAQTGRQRDKDMFWPTLEVGYNVTSLLKKAVDVPVELALALGITALHPAQYANQDIMWPTFYHSMAKGQAANNYGSVYFNLDGTY